MMLGQLLNRESLRNLIVAMEIENRPIYGVTITKDTGNPDENTNKAYKDELLLERVFKPEMYLRFRLLRTRSGKMTESCCRLRHGGNRPFSAASGGLLRRFRRFVG